MIVMRLLFYGVSGKNLQHQYKDFLVISKRGINYHTPNNGLFFQKLRRLSIDETSFSNGELYTILTNKAGKRKELS
jgi:hypothetical protein